jgi:hypothetical protein
MFPHTPPVEVSSVSTLTGTVDPNASIELTGIRYLVVVGVIRTEEPENDTTNVLGRLTDALADVPVIALAPMLEESALYIAYGAESFADNMSKALLLGVTSIISPLLTIEFSSVEVLFTTEALFVTVSEKPLAYPLSVAGTLSFTHGPDVHDCLIDVVDVVFPVELFETMYALTNMTATIIVPMSIM